jgi:transcriptional regulator with XRE-family HTH domain
MEYLKVDGGYLAQKMKAHKLTQKAAAAALCAGDDSTLRKWLSGKVNISSPAKAAIFYYFELLERLNNV